MSSFFVSVYVCLDRQLLLQQCCRWRRILKIMTSSMPFDVSLCILTSMLANLMPHDCKNPSWRNDFAIRIQKKGLAQIAGTNCSRKSAESVAMLAGFFSPFKSNLFQIPILLLMHNLAMINNPGRNLDSKCTPKRRCVYGPVVETHLNALE